MDNRLQYPSATVDFSTVGLSGQDHDDYPVPNTSPRFDWMRMYLMGLMSNQSSHTPPSEYREGTIWYNSLIEQYNYQTSSGFKPISEAIYINENGGQNLSDFVNHISTRSSVNNRLGVFAGKADNSNYDFALNRVLLPPGISEIINYPDSGSIPFGAVVYKNGKILKNSEVELISNSKVQLTGTILDFDDEFCVFIKKLITEGSSLPGESYVATDESGYILTTEDDEVLVFEV